MLFSSTAFLFLFLPATLLLYYGLRKNRRAGNTLLLAASLLFYAWGEPVFVFVMLASIVADWACGLWIDRENQVASGRKAKAALAVGVGFHLALLFVYKYLAFALANVAALCGGRFHAPQIALPIGISFFTFQAISYLADIFRKKADVQRNPLNVGLYISFFPQLIAGPIVRYETVAREIVERKETLEGVSRGACRFLVGLSKKVLLANLLAETADRAFAIPAGELSAGYAWIGALCYAFQIYFDFSGYSDMAIGLGCIFGFHFPENFQYPYISRSITEFWRRWHISLGTWFRDYVYIPLGGSRAGRLRHIGNLLLVWLLTGLWHGASWNFVLWGLYYFVLLAAEKALGWHKRAVGRWIGCLSTPIFVLLGWVLFRAETLAGAWAYLSAMFGISGGLAWDAGAAFALRENALLLTAALACSLPIAEKSRNVLGKSRVWGALYPAAVLLLFLLSVSFLVKGSYNPFIYFNF